jgi:hypothetical protein
MNRRPLEAAHENSQRKIFLTALERGFVDPSVQEMTLQNGDGKRLVVTRQEAQMFLSYADAGRGSPAERLRKRERVKRLHASVLQARAEAA